MIRSKLWKNALFLVGGGSVVHAAFVACGSASNGFATLFGDAGEKDARAQSAPSACKRWEIKAERYKAEDWANVFNACCDLKLDARQSGSAVGVEPGWEVISAIPMKCEYDPDSTASDKYQSYCVAATLRRCAE